MYELEFYEDARGRCPIRDELLVRLIASEMRKFEYNFALVEKLGTRAGCVRPLRDGLWELKIGLHRMPMFLAGSRLIVLTHWFAKTTQKTPLGELARAIKLKHDWEQRRHGQSNTGR